MKTLEGKVAVVAGATRGAGRGIARMLGEAGAIVYCTGRSVSGKPPATGIHAGRIETIEETASLVTAQGGVGIPVRVEHNDEKQVAALVARIREEQGRLDILVNVLGGDTPAEFKPFWKLTLDKGLRWLQQEVGSHIITSRYAAALIVEGGSGLIVELTDGDALYYRQSLFYDLVKVSTIRLAYAMAEELYDKGVAAIALSPGYLRTEWTLDYLGVTEANWREGVKKDPNFIASETPCFVGRAVAALAADARVLEKSGGVYGSWTLSDEYGFTDIDGNRPHLGRHFAEHYKTPPWGMPKTGVSWSIEREPQPKSARKRSRTERAGEQ